MKKIIIVLVIFTFGNFSAKLYAGSDTKSVTLNNKLSEVTWIGKKVSGQHEGAINIKEGALTISSTQLLKGKVVIDMNSITCTDLEGEWNQKLIGHLNSKDFFDVKQFETAILEISSTALIEGNKYTVSGTLTIKGISQPIKFPATIEIKDGKLGAYAEVNVDRTLYDIKYGSGKFFEGLGDKMISDEFIIKFKIAAQ